MKNSEVRFATGGLMQMVKWNPFREFEDIQTRLNRLFEDLPSRRTMERDLTFADWAPAVDVQETDKEYLIKADLPEVKKEDVKVQLQEGVLTLEGERRQEKEEKGKRFHRIEREYGKFVRRFTLPSEIDANQIEAEFKDGVLSVRLPKSAVAKPKAVEVKVA
jgi:HSP20 family protein